MAELNTDLAFFFFLENYGHRRPQSVCHRFALKSRGLGGFLNKRLASVKVRTGMFCGECSHDP